MIEVTSIDEATAYGIPSTRLSLAWRAQERPSLFPTMKAALNLFPLSATETQLELEGTYDPPLGVLGNAIDAVLLHRIAEASVLRFVQDVAVFLRGEA